MTHADEKRVALLEIFSDIHRREGPGRLGLEITFAVDPTIEGLAAALYMDGSASMSQAGNYGRQGLFSIGRRFNPVESAMRVIVPYIAGKDTNGRCRVAYWATGPEGRDVEVVGELSGPEAATAEFRGPRAFGQATYLLAAVRDFVGYVNGLRQGGEAVKTALAVIVTDGQFHDFDEVMTYTEELAKAITAGTFPRTTFTVVGVGPEIDEEQMDELMHEATPDDYAGREIWCYALAQHVGELPELVSHLVDANVPAFWGGAKFFDEHGAVVASFDDVVPAVVEFELPADARSFALEVEGRRYVQPLAAVPQERERRADH